MKNPKLTCFDVGARNGLKDLLKLSESIFLYSFEPNLESDDLLNKTAATKYAAFKIINKGLYKKSGVFDFYTTLNPSMGSMLQPNQSVLQEYFDEIKEFKEWRKQLNVTGTKKINVTTIDKIVYEEKIGEIDYLKLDTQGTELDILKGAENALKEKKILVIKTEFSFIALYKGQAVFSEVDLYLKAFGYKLVSCEFHYDTTSPFKNTGEKPKWGIGGDAYYCIDFEKYGNKEKMYNAAVILAGIGFLSNATVLLDQLNITKSEQLNFYKSVRLRDGKRMLKYLLPPVLINLYKRLFKG